MQKRTHKSANAQRNKNSRELANLRSPQPKIGLLLLGSTGNIGTQTLQILKKHKDKFYVVGLACHHNEKLLKKQAKEFEVPPKNITTTSKTAKKSQQKIYQLIKDPRAEIIVNAISGEAGLSPSIAALKAGKILALANKESVVLDGKNLITLAKKYKAKILPLDSEHHAVARILKYKNLTKFDPQKIKKITITCSGGPFFGWSKKRLAKAEIKDALAHPTWHMGPKITLESALLINKGYELIEAHHLFDCPLKNLDAIIDRKSYVHAIVEFKKESLALAYSPDMRIPIEDALLSYFYQTRKNKIFHNPKLKFLTKNQLKAYPFHKIDHKTFPAIKKILTAYKQKKIKTFFHQKEKKLALFIENKIPFTKI